MTNKPQPTLADVSDWLTSYYGNSVEALAPVSGGFWSSAYSYRLDDGEFILRLSEGREGFDIDAAAMQFCGPDLPVPRVLAVGSGLGVHYAISQRHYGGFVENAPVEHADRAGAAIADLLMALRDAPTDPDLRVDWFQSSADKDWHGWLLAGLVDNGGSLTAGWRNKVRADPQLESLFLTCVERIHQLLPQCPERRDLVHGDLLHQNVLLSPDSSQVTGIFSWKCSALGDFLFDVAWCTFWAPWHPVIGAADLWSRTLQSPDLSDKDLRYAGERRHCYELQIAASHIGWFTWLDDRKNLEVLSAHTEGILARGPLR